MMTRCKHTKWSCLPALHYSEHFWVATDMSICMLYSCAMGGKVSVAQKKMNYILAVASRWNDGTMRKTNLKLSPAWKSNPLFKRPNWKIRSLNTKDHTPPPQPVSRAPPGNFQTDADIQEVAPIKTEPVSLPTVASTLKFTTSLSRLLTLHLRRWQVWWLTPTWRIQMSMETMRCLLEAMQVMMEKP